MLAKETGIKESYKLKHEYLFEWEIPDRYVEHRVSVETLLDRGLSFEDYLTDDGRLPCLEEFRSLMIKKVLNPAFNGYTIGKHLGQMARCFGARAPVKEIANQILTDCPQGFYPNYKGQFVRWKERKDDVPETVDFDHFYWITRGINESLFDCWLSDAIFVEDFLAHVKWANELTKEMEILWELYWDNLCDEIYTGANSNSAANRAQELQVRESQVNEMIEKEAVSIGLWSIYSCSQPCSPVQK